MIERLFKNWRTTVAALVLAVLIFLLVFFDKVSFSDITGIVLLLAGGGSAVGLALSRDPKKKDTTP